MKIRRQIVVFDAADLAAESGFWAGLLGGTFNAEAISLGARLLQPADDPEAAELFQVYADPAGHPFCLCWAAADS